MIVPTKRVVKMLWILLLVSLCSVDSQSCLLPRNPSNCSECADEGLDPSTDCTTCLRPPIECEEGDQNCAIGNFKFSALFHSYANPSSMCALCGNSGPVTCAEADILGGMTSPGGAREDCGLRFIYCLQPFESGYFDPPYLPQRRFGSGSDSVSFEGDFITQTNAKAAWNRSNPFTAELRSWPGRVQFYIVVYHFCFGCSHGGIVDRMYINLELNVSSGFTERKTYHGIRNYTQFDMSFKVERVCEENYYGLLCNIFCSEEGVFACDREGNTVCANSAFDLVSNCTQCLEMDRDPENNCVEDATITDASSATMQATSPSIIVSPELIGGMVGGGLGGLLLLLIITVLLVILCLSRERGTGNQDDRKEWDGSIYNITLQDNVGYGVTDGSKSNPQSPHTIDNSYDYIMSLQTE